MRACRLNKSKKEKQVEAELPGETKHVDCAESSVDCTEDCLQIAGAYWKIGKSQLDLFLKNKNPPVQLSEDMNHAITALKIAKELYQENGKKDKANEIQELLEKVAEKFLSIGRKFIEPHLNKPKHTSLAVFQAIEKGITALTYAAEVYEIIGSMEDAIFAWDMIKAAPTDGDIQQKAVERIQKCESKLPAKKTGPGVNFFPHPPSSKAASSSSAAACASAPH